MYNNECYYADIYSIESYFKKQWIHEIPNYFLSTASTARIDLFKEIITIYWKKLNYDQQLSIIKRLPWYNKIDRIDRNPYIFTEIREKGIIKYISDNYRVNTTISSRILGLIFNIDPQKIFECRKSNNKTKNNISNDKNENNISDDKNKNYIEVILPSTFISSEKKYNISFVCREKNKNCNYEIWKFSAEKESDIFVICPIINNKYMIGRTYVNPHLFNFDIINEEHRKNIILFLDPDILFFMLQKSDEARLYERYKDFVISGCFGGYDNIEEIDYSTLFLKNIILIPSIKDEDLSQLNKWIEKIQTHSHPNSIRIYPWIVSNKYEKDITKSNGIMAARAEKYDCVQNLEIVSSFIHRLMADSLSLEEYRVWRDKLSPKKEQDISEDMDSALGSVSLVDLMSRGPKIRSDLSWDSLITGNSQTLIWGKSNSGKSTLSVSLALTLSKGGETFGLKANRTRKILYLDGEAGKDGFKEMCSRFNPEDITPKFRYIYTKDFVKHRDEILHIIDSEDIEVVFLDNILSICRNAIHNPGIVTNFGSDLQKRNVALVTIHHAGKDGTSSIGSVDLESLSKNVFKIHKCTLDNTEKSQELTITLEVTEWKKGENMPTITAAFRDGKFCVLEGSWTTSSIDQQNDQAEEKSQALDASTCAEPSAQEPKDTSMLPSDSTTQEMESDSSEPRVESSSEIVGNVMEHSQYKPSPNALRVLEAIKNSECQATRKYLEEFLKLSSSQVQKLLQELRENALIEQKEKALTT